MRLLKRIVMLGLASCLVPPPAAGQTAPRRLALLVGTNRYLAHIDGLDRVAYAEADVSGLKAVLDAQGFETVVVTGDAVRREVIVAELTRLAREVREQDEVVFFLAGTTVRGGAGTRPRIYWLGYTSTLAGLDADAMRLDQLLDDFREIRARRKLALLDVYHA
ncbi:MAG TPA: caspase family protein, partial [Vicinamibacteria bacterium]|nr:caspase family protein [Vicinamibacteria bacterium]